MKRYKGAFWLPFILGAVIVAAVALIIFGLGGFGFGGGKGDGEGDGTKPVMAEVSESEPEQEAAMEEIKYADVSVSGGDYLWQNRKSSISEIVDDISSMEEKPFVRIIDDGASIKAYDALIKAFKDNNIRYIEETV